MPALRLAEQTALRQSNPFKTSALVIKRLTTATVAGLADLGDRGNRRHGLRQPVSTLLKSWRSAS